VSRNALRARFDAENSVSGFSACSRLHLISKWPSEEVSDLRPGRSYQGEGCRFPRDVLKDDEQADEVEAESPESYADRKRITITNSPQRRRTNVANGNNDTMTKADLQDCIDQATQILTDAYIPEASREDLATAIGDAWPPSKGTPARTMFRTTTMTWTDPCPAAVSQGSGHGSRAAVSRTCASAAGRENLRVLWKPPKCGSWPRGRRRGEHEPRKI
jgi:hypothetical protein